MAAKEGIADDLHIKYTDYDDTFNGKVNKALEQGIREFKPEFDIYNAGTDCLQGDLLGCLSVSAAGIIQRD